ncbi:hypothetical protein [Thiolinea disciformis]|uniref:hypothetical protein n=1 Tax=Thiolinea disciformis TaxID=125614 RepID=UPI000369F773|nr:hypothetical protein [Thiolinea disciformis]
MDMPANTLIYPGNFDTYKNPPYISIVGKQRNRDIGITYDIPAGKVVYIKKLKIENTFLPLVKKGEGQLTIEDLEIKDFGGDAINIRGSNVRINKLSIRNSTPTRPYSPVWIPEYSEKAILKALADNKEQVYDWRLLEWLPVSKDNITTYYTPGYHVDAGLQAYYVPSMRLQATFPMPKPGNAYSSSLPTLSSANINVVAQDLYPNREPPRVMAKPAQAGQAAPHKKVQTQADPAVLRLLQDLARADIPYETQVAHTGSQRITQIMPLLDFNPKPPRLLARPRTGGHPVVGQSSSNTEEPIISNIRIEQADINTDSLVENPTTQQIQAIPNPKAQVFMFSEPHRYTNIHIGNKGLAVKSSYRYWFAANTLESSTIGSYISPPRVQLTKNPSPTGCAQLPCIRIGDGLAGSPYLIKPSMYSTKEVTLIRVDKKQEAPEQVVYR